MYSGDEPCEISVTSNSSDLSSREQRAPVVTYKLTFLSSDFREGHVVMKAAL